MIIKKYWRIEYDKRRRNQTSLRGYQRQPIRAYIGKAENLLKDYLQVAKDQLKALGMNTDSKERKTDEDGEDGLTEFMNALSNN
jgi:hypothetical protein